MPTRCLVHSCFNTGKNKSVTFHGLPMSPLRRRKWLIAIKRDPNEKYSKNVVCSEHFLPEDFEPWGAHRRLKFTALPSQKLPTVISGKRKYHFKQPLTTLDISEHSYSSLATSRLVKIGSIADLPANFRPITLINQGLPKTQTITSQGTSLIVPKIVNVESVKKEPLDSVIKSEPSDLAPVGEKPQDAVFENTQIKSELGTFSVSSSTDTSEETTVTNVSPSISAKLNPVRIEVINEANYSLKTPSKNPIKQKIVAPSSLSNAQSIDSLKQQIKLVSGQSLLIVKSLSQLGLQIKKDGTKSVSMAPSQSQVRPLLVHSANPIKVGSTLKIVTAPLKQVIKNEAASSSSMVQTPNSVQKVAIQSSSSSLGQEIKPIIISSSSDTDSGDESGKAPCLSSSSLPQASSNPSRHQIQKIANKPKFTQHSLGQAVKIQSSSISQTQQNPVIQKVNIRPTLPSASISGEQLNKMLESADQTSIGTSISEDQLIQMLETDSPLLTAELLFGKNNQRFRAKRKCYVADLSLRDFETPEGKKEFIKGQVRVKKDTAKAKVLRRVNSRLRSKLDKMKSILNYLEKTCDVSAAKKVLEGEEDEEFGEYSSNDSDSASDSDEDLNEEENGDPVAFEENATQFDPFGFSNQVQVTYLSAANDSINEGSLKKKLKYVAGRDIHKSKKIRDLNNIIFMKNQMIEDLKSEIEQLQKVD